MTDNVNESELVSESLEKVSAEKDSLGNVNNASPDVSSRNKLKNRFKKRSDQGEESLGRKNFYLPGSDKRKHFGTKTSTSRKCKSSRKVMDSRSHKESRERKFSSENQCSFSDIHIKEEYFSDDDQNSSVSDNRHVLVTRSRIRRIQRRKAYSSNSSAMDSDNRKTKSEPIITITLDSDSDDNVSVVSNRPNRSARIRGELIRKLSGTTTKISTFKTCDSSSSSEFESVRQKKKSKSRSVKSSSSQVAKRKKYLVKRLACQTRIKLRKHRKPRIPIVYTTSRKKRDLRSIRKRYIDQKKENQGSKSSMPVKRSSTQSTNITERRTLRSTSTDTTMDNSIKQENITDNIKIEKHHTELKLQLDIKTLSEVKKSNTGNTKRQTKKDIVNDPPKNKEVSIENKVFPEIKEIPLESKDVPSENKLPLESKELPSEILSEAETSEKLKKISTNGDSVASSKIDLKKETEIELHPEVNTNLISDKNKELEQESNMEVTPSEITKQILDINEKTKESEAKSEIKIKTVMPSTAGEEKVTTEKKKRIPVLVRQKERKMKKKIKPGDKILRKRGRPRLSDSKPVKSIPLLNDVIQIPFLQSSFCFVVAPKLPKCRECRIAVNRTNRSMQHAYCRFMEYRKLCYNKTGGILNAGFSEPSEATIEHLSQWLPQIENPPRDLNCNTSKALIEHIGDQFCDLIEQEKEALSLHVGKDKIITWKRIVQGVREMCDVCYTTLFNIHWVCPICGLAVCIDCYKGRKQGITVEYEDGQPKNRDQYNWLLCTLRQPHDTESLVMAQIIPGNALWIMKDLLHKARKQWDIPAYCRCNPHAITSSDKYISTGICKQLMCSVTKSFPTERSNLYYNNGPNVQNGENNYDDLDFEVSGTALKWLEGDLDGLKSSDDYFAYEDFSSLRGNLLNGMNGEDSSSELEREVTSFSLDEIISCVTKSKNTDNKENSGNKTIVKHFSNRFPQPKSGRDPLPIRIYTKLESDLAFSDVPHSWFCNGRLLFLLKSDHPDNLALFQEQWKRGQPILVKGVNERLSIELWHPDAFCRDFGEVRNDLVDCRTGAVIRNLPMKRFWEGFESFAKRLKDDDGEFMLLKLKDWPPGEDFSEMLPRRFHDLMDGLPLPEYTHRDGILNLAGRLPSWFVRPDLGPKMYNAYGSALYPTKGTTNLHLDVSDAVNVMVYVGIPQDGNAHLHIEEALKAIDEGGCDSLMRARVRCRGAKPGALWHIYNARDADKIREMLTKVAIERGEKLEAHHDPIHDQSWYLDAELRKRLYRDYGVEGYAIAQCLGDAVFIPAGAPHQVRNLHSCVKVAEDFVSPENIAHCFKLTQEFRHLSDTHTNHEDKLQIKNIIYHVVRDALAHLLANSEAVQHLLTNTGSVES